MSGSKCNVQYPAPTGPYKVELRNNVPWRHSDHIRIQISIGNALTEGDKFYAFCEWAVQRFARVSVIVGDTLQRHNIGLQDNLSMPCAWALSRSAGDAWLQRNQEALRLIPAARIVRWDGLLADPRHVVSLGHLEVLYGGGEDFARAVDATVAAFWQRNSERLGGIRRARFEEVSRTFLLEELAHIIRRSFACDSKGGDEAVGFA